MFSTTANRRQILLGSAGLFAAAPLPRRTPSYWDASKVDLPTLKLCEGISVHHLKTIRSRKSTLDDFAASHAIVNLTAHHLAEAGVGELVDRQIDLWRGNEAYAIKTARESLAANHGIELSSHAFPEDTKLGRNFQSMIVPTVALWAHGIHVLKLKHPSCPAPQAEQSFFRDAVYRPGDVKFVEVQDQMKATCFSDQWGMYNSYWMQGYYTPEQSGQMLAHCGGSAVNQLGGQIMSYGGQIVVLGGVLNALGAPEAAEPTIAVGAAFSLWGTVISFFGRMLFAL